MINKKIKDYSKSLRDDKALASMCVRFPVALQEDVRVYCARNGITLVDFFAYVAGKFLDKNKSELSE